MQICLPVCVKAVQTDVEYLHNVRMRDVEEAQQRIVSIIRRLEDEGNSRYLKRAARKTKSSHNTKARNIFWQAYSRRVVALIIPYSLQQIQLLSTTQ